ncbi:MAG: hypothetical protein H0X39_05545 [Actinobacteria bacterium]|nr:hypothetical protein [Actinomycetota bacterium]
MANKPPPNQPLLEKKRLLAFEALLLSWSAARLIRRSQRFTRKAYALDRHGRSVRVDDKGAVRFCLAGALLRAEHNQSGIEMAQCTVASVEVDDLLEPVSPAGSPLRLHLALQLLAVASQEQLGEFGVTYRGIDPSAEQAKRIPTYLHLPLILGLHPKGKHRVCLATLTRVAVSLAVLARNDELLDRVIPDHVVVKEGEV